MPTLIISPTRVTFGETSADLSPPLDLAEFEKERVLLLLAANFDVRLLPPKVQELVKQVTPDWLRDLGHRLFERAIPARIAAAWLERSGALALALDPALERLPWELLRDGGDFLARTRGIVRVRQSPSNPTRAVAPPDRLRVLIALASPVLDESLQDVEDSRQPAIVNLEREAAPFRDLDGASFPADITLRLHVTPDELDFALGEANVFHFVGHGGIGTLLLENRDGTTRAIDTAWLRERFANRAVRLANRAVRLAVFQACLTAVAPPPTLSLPWKRGERVSRRRCWMRACQWRSR